MTNKEMNKTKEKSRKAMDDIFGKYYVAPKPKKTWSKKIRYKIYCWIRGWEFNDF